MTRGDGNGASTTAGPNREREKKMRTCLLSRISLCVHTTPPMCCLRFYVLHHISCLKCVFTYTRLQMLHTHTQDFTTV